MRCYIVWEPRLRPRQIRWRWKLCFLICPVHTQHRMCGSPIPTGPPPLRTQRLWEHRTDRALALLACMLFPFQVQEDTWNVNKTLVWGWPVILSSFCFQGNIGGKIFSALWISVIFWTNITNRLNKTEGRASIWFDTFTFGERDPGHSESFIFN